MRKGVRPGFAAEKNFFPVRLHIANGRWLQIAAQARERGLRIDQYVTEMVDAALADQRTLARIESTCGSSLAAFQDHSEW